MNRAVDQPAGEAPSSPPPNPASNERTSNGEATADSVTTTPDTERIQEEFRVFERPIS
jgi:hypothetical protein